MMNNKLDDKFKKLQEYDKEIKIKNLNKKIYDLNLSEEEISKYSPQELSYIHITLHNSLYFKKPFNDFIKIKKIHDLIIKFLDSHPIIDKLDHN